MNKTFLLIANASYTEGSHLLVIDSIEEYVTLFKEYHAKKRDFLLEKAPLYFKRAINDEWRDIIDKYQKLEEQFALENNNKPFNFELSTGCYIEKGRGEGNFYNNIIISKNPDKDDCWYIAKEFMSDLPRGTHYCGDYCDN